MKRLQILYDGYEVDGKDMVKALGSWLVVLHTGQQFAKAADSDELNQSDVDQLGSTLEQFVPLLCDLMVGFGVEPDELAEYGNSHFQMRLVYP